jgi:hypothetical protein
MFLEIQQKKTRKYYGKMLSAVGSLSRLFSESEQPYLPYRLVENLFCKAFDAKNLSRGDISVDASKSSLGFGIKTFLHKNGRSFEKVAEFNRAHRGFAALSPKKMIATIAELRNERIEATKRIADVDSIIYHCVTRDRNKILFMSNPCHLSAYPQFATCVLVVLL